MNANTTEAADGSESHTKDLLCCPFCGGSNLTNGYWSLDGGEVDAIECNDCFAGAPIDTWLKRNNELPAEGAEYYFEGEKWRVVNHNYNGIGYRDLTITLERTDIDPNISRKEDMPEQFKLTAT